jgi:hypothetical protein
MNMQALDEIVLPAGDAPGWTLIAMSGTRLLTSGSPKTSIPLPLYQRLAMPSWLALTVSAVTACQTRATSAWVSTLHVAHSTSAEVPDDEPVSG